MADEPKLDAGVALYGRVGLEKPQSLNDQEDRVRQYLEELGPPIPMFEEEKDSASQ